MEIESGNEVSLTPPKLKEAAEAVSLNLLPEKSRKVYTTVYDSFLNWRKKNNANSFSESVLLVYFTELSAKYKPSTLWSYYSMLRSTISLHQGIDLENYIKLRALLKQKSEGFQSKKASTFSPKNINDFLKNASDDNYLATKVALIMGVMGACRANEMYSMKTDDLQDLGSAFLVNVPNAKTKIARKFTVTDNFYDMCKKYINSRPHYVTTNVFFLNYQNGKCTAQRIGINKFTKMGKDIAFFLQLPNPEKYSGHSFRRSSTILVDTGGDITALKRHGGWKSTTVAEGYIVDTIKNKIDTVKKNSNSIQVNTNYKHIHLVSINDRNITFDNNSLPAINLTNCSNITININK